jgi:predicted RNA-binding protein with PIN domain
VEVLIVDGANVVGSRPDGWWRDRPGAARRLLEQLEAADLPHDDVVLVLEGAAKRGIPAEQRGRVRVLHAPGSGDDAIVDEVSRQVAAGDGRRVVVVTADRVLRERVVDAGGETTSPRSFLDQL